MVLTTEMNIGRVGIESFRNILDRKVAGVIIMYGFLVSKETVILHWWESETKIGFNQTSQ